ncbi:MULTISPECIES: potassium-transporting ATPase subunit KdpA [Pseudomonas]|jgi:K+-transporting ATPase ATPase A chain|uniref:Potassium-transporting ATPase potassium-binding subunit n=1 Tax=Pseudomonas gingeri TaxID=117681 RepID=A0A7Y8BJX9_9PSED|nr:MULTISPECIES: potassium-transporting ATPase subunit KdpA [Pseudomonas]MCU1738393.1 potassium-transporting ATPase subunit KdpA [Pseudomonas sp. 20S_6.2_Bac1]NWB46454.1 potassium-transporting ATPase subunit KdpA [Pseudomonas gingeri]
MSHLWLQIIITLIATLALSLVVGRYLARVVTDQKTVLDRVLDPVDNLLYRLIGKQACSQAMNWKSYTLHMLATNLVMALLIYLVLIFQNVLPLNPQHFAGMEPMQAFNTAISFITNTNWQSYGGESTLSNFSQMAAITFPMFTSAATGFVVAIAFIRALLVTDGGANLGNFYRDLIRFITRVLLPVVLVLSLFLIWQGVPQTLDASLVTDTLQGGHQTLTLGPVAAQEAIENLGTNGGGFFNVNAAHPFQNPNALTNFVLILLMASLPAALVVMFGHMIKNHRQSTVIYSVMALMLVGFLLLCVIPEQAGTPLLSQLGIDTHASALQAGGNMEGKEVRFGIAQSGLFAAYTTAFTTGAINSMHDSFTPLGGLSTLVQMMLQCVFGGKGVGFLNFLIYGLIGIFVAGLMVGRTPEFLGKKIEKREIILVSLAMLIHPLVILAPSAWSMVMPYGVASLGNAGVHGYSEVLYAFTSAAANNGSAFGGLNANTPWYNIAIACVIVIGRYPSIIFLMAVAGSLAAKPTLQPNIGTLRTDTPMFGIWWLATIVIVGALTFLPALVLGPIAEFFAMNKHLLF